MFCIPSGGSAELARPEGSCNQGVVVKRFLVALSVMASLTIGPVTLAQDYEIVNCCIKPCSCLGSKAGKPECKKISRSECKRLGGEVVVDCILCD
ncbi:MAG TPA: hypothetical protein VK463_21035 [Desulfomonilaceae bacterium]|nr:hypothetical protein [Desulfomonilaceae bacterium]